MYFNDGAMTMLGHCLNLHGCSGSSSSPPSDDGGTGGFGLLLHCLHLSLSLSLSLSIKEGKKEE